MKSINALASFVLRRFFDLYSKPGQLPSGMFVNLLQIKVQSPPRGREITFHPEDVVLIQMRRG